MAIRKIIILVAFAALALTFVPTSASVSASVAASGPVFPLMYRTETLPDGVWFRNSPHTADTDRITGHGVYAGDSVQLECYAFGDAVGSYNDSLWYYVANLTRPVVPSTGAQNVGYLNAHYINDGQAANQVDAGVPACGAAPPTPTPTATAFPTPMPTATPPSTVPPVPTATPPVAASGPVFPVINTSETLPDGVWFRNSPHTDDTDRVTGHGVYAGDSVQLECYAFGDAVGSYNDSLWYYVANLTRPVVPDTGAPNVGYLNAHYINDGQAANQVDAGIPACGAASPTPALPEGASAFFRPEQNRWTAWLNPWPESTADINDPFAVWKSPGGCYGGGGITNPYNGRWVSILSGWSLGRLGPIYYLMRATSEQKSHIHYILLIDPGRAKEMSEGCDAVVSPSVYLASWLALNKQNHLMILAGSATGSDGGNGLTYYYLTAIRQDGLLGQVTICWDDKLAHETPYDKYAVNPATSLISHPSNSCPAHY